MCVCVCVHVMHVCMLYMCVLVYMHACMCVCVRACVRVLALLETEMSHKSIHCFNTGQADKFKLHTFCIDLYNFRNSRHPQTVQSFLHSLLCTVQCNVITSPKDSTERPCWTMKSSHTGYNADLGSFLISWSWQVT